MTRRILCSLICFFLIPTFVFAETSDDVDVENETDLVEEVQDPTSQEDDVNLSTELSVSNEDEAEVEKEEEAREVSTTSSTKTPDEWYEEGMNDPSATKRVEIFEEAYSYYPENEKIISGLNESVRNLLNWASGKHNSGDFDTAIDRYNYIITVEGISSTYSDEASWKKEYAINKTNYPTADQLYDEAMSESTASGRFDAFIESYTYYPNNKRILEGLRSSAELLYNWAIKQHGLRKFDTAIDRYERLLTSDALTSSFLSKVESRLNEALQEKRPPEIIYEEAKNEYSASRKLELYIEGYDSYPDNTDFINGVNDSGKLLLSWARGQHQSGKWSTAIDRYLKILDSPVTSKSLQDSVALHLEKAENRNTIPTATSLREEYKKQTKVSEIFRKSVENFLYYPESEKFETEMNHAAEQLLIWARGKHDNGDFTTAKNRYEIIISTTYINESIRNKTESLLSDAEVGKRSADAIYQDAVEEGRASYKLNLFINGYEFYPDDQRFIKGIQDSAEALFDYAVRKHNAGDFVTAIERYEIILASPSILDSTSEKTQGKLADAKIGKRPADVIYNLVREETTASGLFEMNSQGYYFYPEDDRFITGLAESSKKLLELAERYHSQGRFTDANSRYEKLLITEGVPDSYETKAMYLQKYSVEEKLAPNAEDYEALIEKEATISGKLDIAVEGYWIYSEKPLMVNLVIENAYGLLKWATGVHQRGDITTALNRYNRILDLPVKNDDLITETTLKKSYADSGEVLPTADQIYNEAQEETRASYIFDLYVKGNILYRNDERFKVGIEESSISLLNLAIRYHDSGQYDSAIDRYDTLISTVSVPSHISLEAELRKRYAKNSQIVPKANDLYNLALKHTTVSGKFDAFVEGYVIYPSDERFVSGLEISAYDLYKYTIRIHKNKDFRGAISRYEKLINSPGIPDYIVEGALANLEYAKDRIVPVSQMINFTEYNISLQDALSIQMKVSPQTDKYIGVPAFAHGNYIRIIQDSQISGSTVNVRTAPILEDKYVSKSLNGGTKVEILDRVVGDSFSGSKLWYKIDYNGEILYAHTLLVDPAIGETTANVNMRMEPDSNSHSFGTMSKGSRITIIGSTGNWYKVIYDKDWKNATSNDTEYYLDPTNFINDNNQKYQFLDLRYYTGIPSSELKDLLKGKGKLDGMEDVFREAAKRAGINELYLISHALLETGHGTSTLARGVEYNGKTVYNFFGIAAVDGNAVNGGAKRAYEEGWFTVEDAIIGGAEFAKQKYIYAGQNTLYSMRWNPAKMDQNGYATHQYATDIGWAYKQVAYYTRFYSKGDYNLIFDIPVYK
ncbi:SH3 domain-containing protein [Ornithinibacillus caprae]|nr:SH3 domain-containing protein [Ornithinibacillus caprae]